MSHSVGYATRQLSGCATIRKRHLQMPSCSGIPCHTLGMGQSHQRGHCTGCPAPSQKSLDHCPCFPVVATLQVCSIMIFNLCFKFFSVLMAHHHLTADSLSL